MSRRSRDRSNVPTRAQIAEKHRQLCTKGKHEWRPSFVSECLGSPPKWDGSVIHCEWCHIQSTLDELEVEQREMVAEVAIILSDTYEKVALLHPTRTFSNSGI